MKHVLINLWVSVLAFGVGLSVSSLWRIYALPKLPEPIYVNETAEPPTISPVHPGGIVSVMHACGPKANFHSYDLADGSQVSVECRGYGSSAAANRALHRRLRDAGRVVERSKNYGERGQVEGETIVAVGNNAIEIRTFGVGLCVTTAPSLKILQSRLQW